MLGRAAALLLLALILAAFPAAVLYDTAREVRRAEGGTHGRAYRDR